MTEKLSIEERFKNIECNLEFINSEIERAAKISGRKREDIKLMAVTKTVEPIFINHAIECGIDLIGENKVQEFLSKKEFLTLDGVDAHLIGHLQTNKVKQIVGNVSTIQSLDSLKLANEIEKQSKKLGITTDCLVEVNVANEESKTGIDSEELFDLLYQIAELGSIKVKGLMAIPPICDNEVQLNKYFAKMSDLFVDIRSKKIDNICMEILSMGMSSDYTQAIINGANMVRVGSSIFGPRLY